MKKMNIFILIAISLISCDKGRDITEEVETPNILTTKTITIDQQIGSQIVGRSVIIRAPIVSNAEKKYPLVFAFAPFFNCNALNTFI